MTEVTGILAQLNEECALEKSEIRGLNEVSI